MYYTTLLPSVYYLNMRVHHIIQVEKGTLYENITGNFMEKWKYVCTLDLALFLKSIHINRWSFISRFFV